MENTFKKALEDGTFAITIEIIPGRGGGKEPGQQREFHEGIEIWNTGRVHALSVTDNPGGNPAILADDFAYQYNQEGICTITHMTCKDRSRNQIQAQFYALDRLEMPNLLCMSGDYPVSGYKGRSRPVYDLDPVQMLQMVTDMNKGLVQQTPKGDVREIASDFFAGCCVSPFKYTEAETIMQYKKMEKKLWAGAQFIIPQLGYDMRKAQELLFYLRDRGYKTPVIGNVYIMGAGPGRFMNAGGVPGGVVTDEFLEVLKEEAAGEDKGKAAKLERAAKMVAAYKGMGYAGVHIGAPGLSAEIINTILDRAEELAPQWEQCARDVDFGKLSGFYLYQSDGCGLNTHDEAPLTERDHDRKTVMKNYGLSRFFHHWVLTPGKRFYGILESTMERKEKKKGMNRKHTLENLSKTMLYGCMSCGDCGLEAAVYTCPMTQCPKSQRNGPCGGSADGWCEVYPDEKRCIWYKAYHRLKRYDELEKLDSFVTPPNNWDFSETSGWSNYTHKRDNCAHREMLPPQGERAQSISQE